jgi:hypothetical protein
MYLLKLQQVFKEECTKKCGGELGKRDPTTDEAREKMRQDTAAEDGAVDPFGEDDEWHPNEREKEPALGFQGTLGEAQRYC